MILQKVIPFAHSLLHATVNQNDYVIDATVGNGNDTVVLANLIGDNGKVYGFDIQNQAITNTKIRLQENNLLHRVELFHESHNKMKEVLPENTFGQIAAAIFNLGYLPGGDKSITTKSETTIETIQQLLDILKKEGIIVLVVYPGHPEGKKERDALINYVKNLDQNKAQVLEYRFLNQKNNPPFIIAIEKR